MNSNVESPKIDHKNDNNNNNNSDATYEFKDPSGERSMPTTFSQPASKRVLPQTLQKKYHDLWLQNITSSMTRHKELMDHKHAVLKNCKTTL